MAKPNHLDIAAHELAGALARVAPAAKGADPLARRAFDHALAAAEKLSQWRRDTTETSRRHAYGQAVAASALVAVAPWSPVQEAVKRAAFGIERACEGDSVAALRLAGQVFAAHKLAVALG